MLAECLLTLLERLLCFELTSLVGVHRHGPVSIALLVLFLGRFGGAGSRLVLLPLEACRGLFEQNARDAEVNKGNEKEIIITILSFLYLLAGPTVTAAIVLAAILIIIAAMAAIPVAITIPQL